MAEGEARLPLPFHSSYLSREAGESFELLRALATWVTGDAAKLVIRCVVVVGVAWIASLRSIAHALVAVLFQLSFAMLRGARAAN